MTFLYCVVSFILGVVIFGFLNKIFDIYYFGFKGIVSTFSGCWFAGGIIIVLFGYAAKWLILIFAILWLLAKIFKRGKKGGKTAVTENKQGNTPGPKTK